MKRLIKIFVLLLFTNFICACEDVIEIDTPTTEPRLIIDALVRVDRNNSTTKITLNANTTNSFFSNIVPVKLNQAVVINPDYVPTSPLDVGVINLTEVAPGIYEGEKSTVFFTEGELQLVVEYNDQKYLAITRFVPSSNIDSISQGEESLFSEDDTEILISFTDNGETDNFYLFDFNQEDYLVTEDEFYQGQTFNFSYFIEAIGSQELKVALLGVDESFYNYMNQLIQQAGENQGPFQTPSGTVRGNLINITDIDNINSFDNVENSSNFALGYFAVCETFEASIILE